MLQRLDVSKNLKLQYLDCMENDLTELNVSNNLFLKTLECGGNKITDLDLKKNINLQSLRCWNAVETYSIDDFVYHRIIRQAGLKTLDLSKNEQLCLLDCAGNHLETLDLSHNNQLCSIDCRYNLLTSLDVRNTNLPNYEQKLGDHFYPLKCSNMPSLKTLYIKREWTLKGINNPRLPECIDSQTNVISCFK